MLNGVLEINEAGELTCALSGNGMRTIYIQERPLLHSVSCGMPSYQNPVHKAVTPLFCLCMQSAPNPRPTALPPLARRREYYSGPAIFKANSITVNYNGNGVA